MQKPEEKKVVVAIPVDHIRYAFLRVRRWARNQAPKGHKPPRHIREKAVMLQAIRAQEERKGAPAA